PALAHNAGRVARVAVIDGAIGDWAASRTQDEVLAILNEARIPAGRIYDIADIAADPHYRARDMILDQALPDGTPCQVPGIVPKLSATPGGIDRPAPALGEHTDAVLERLGVDVDTRARWREQGFV
ncbi:CoA transferase, partial [Castellaniella sp.]|uniref:CoA transferase n=1 Tax=Castellaniella sp. TaxID=1955812 RepID=UPI003C742B97